MNKPPPPEPEKIWVRCRSADKESFTCYTFYTEICETETTEDVVQTLQSKWGFFDANKIKLYIKFPVGFFDNGCFSYFFAKRELEQGECVVQALKNAKRGMSSAPSVELCASFVSSD